MRRRLRTTNHWSSVSSVRSLVRSFLRPIINLILYSVFKPSQPDPEPIDGPYKSSLNASGILNTLCSVSFAQTIGFLVGGMIVAFRVTSGLSSPSEFVVFVIYLGQVGFRAYFANCPAGN